MYWQDPFPCHPPVLGIAFIAFAEKGWVVPRYPFVLAVPSSAFPRYRGWYRQIRKGWVYFFRSLVLVVPFRYWVQAQGAATHLWKRDGGDKRSQTAAGVPLQLFFYVCGSHVLAVPALCHPQVLGYWPSNQGRDGNTVLIYGCALGGPSPSPPPPSGPRPGALTLLGPSGTFLRPSPAKVMPYTHYSYCSIAQIKSFL